MPQVVAGDVEIPEAAPMTGRQSREGAGSTSKAFKVLVGKSSELSDEGAVQLEEESSRHGKEGEAVAEAGDNACTCRP